MVFLHAGPHPTNEVSGCCGFVYYSIHASTKMCCRGILDLVEFSVYCTSIGDNFVHLNCPCPHSRLILKASPIECGRLRELISSGLEEMPLFFTPCLFPRSKSFVSDYVTKNVNSNLHLMLQSLTHSLFPAL